MNTLTMSDAPRTNSAASESQKLVETPKMIVAIPKTATDANILTPVFVCRGRRPSEIATKDAPTAGAPRRTPNPTRPTSKKIPPNTRQKAGGPPGKHPKKTKEKNPP